MAGCGACGVPPTLAVPAVASFFSNTLAGQFHGSEVKKQKQLPPAFPPAAQPAMQPGPIVGAVEPPSMSAQWELLGGSDEQKKQEQFHSFATDLFGSSSQETPHNGDDVTVMSSYAKGSGLKWTLPPIVDPEMAIDAGMHLLAKAFFYEDELALAVQLLRSHSGAPLPVVELKGAEGSAIRTFKFDLDFLRALLRRVSAGTAVLNALKPLLVFCCYCMTIRAFLYELQSYETLLAAAEMDGGNTAGVVPDNVLPNLYNATDITALSSSTGSAVFTLVQITRGLWKWPAASDSGPAFEAFQTGAPSSNGFSVGAETWVFSSTLTETAKQQQEALLKAASKEAWLVTDRAGGLTLVARLARAAWRSYFCDAIVRRFYQVAQRYSDFQEKHRRQAPGPFMADADFLQSGSSAPGGLGKACPPGQIPTLAIPADAEAQKRFKLANGGPTKAAAEGGAEMDGTESFPIGIEEARVPGTQMLKPGVEVTGCLPARALTDTVAGGSLQPLPVVDPFGKALPVPQNPGQPGTMGFSLSGGQGNTVGVPLSFHGNTLSFAAPTANMEGMTGVSASSPLIQQYFAHFNAPPFRAMMITPKL
jgi:hypothetical protein